MDNGYTIKDLIALFLSKIWLIIIATICGGAAAFSVSKFVLPLQYSSHIAMYVQSYTDISEDASPNNNISNSKQLVNTYIEVLKDDAVMGAVGDKLAAEFDADVLARNFSIANGKITPNSLRACISITSVSDTSALKVTTTTEDPKVAAAICNDIAKVAPEFLREAVGVGSINTIDTAKVYSTPVAPNIPKNTLLGLAAGCMLSVLLILVIDFFDNTIKDTDGLSKRYNKAILGEIQQYETKKKKHEEDRHFRLSDESIPFPIVESYKSLRTNVTFALSTSEKRIFAVSSANPGEGKSTISANIAIAFAQSGRKVLLIDADMRKPVQHKIFEVPNETGLSTVISRQAELEECIQKTQIENLNIMTVGEVPPNPSELLASKQMGKILDTLSEQYSVIIIDTPPINIVTDAMELAKRISGILTVLRFGRTTEDDIEELMKKIDLSQMRMLGFVLNNVEQKRRGGYYSKYGYRKGYYSSYYRYDNTKSANDPKEGS